MGPIQCTNVRRRLPRALILGRGCPVRRRASVVASWMTPMEETKKQAALGKVPSAPSGLRARVPQEWMRREAHLACRGWRVRT